MYPEWIYGRIQPRTWFFDGPSEIELNHSIASQNYLTFLWNEMTSPPNKESKGNGPKPATADIYFEELARYFFCCIPGFRTWLNISTKTGEYDVCIAREGPANDFRSEFSRLFLCECKWKSSKLALMEMNHFLAKLINIGAGMGVVFSRHGLSGEDADKGKNKKKRFIRIMSTSAYEGGRAEA